MDGVDLVRYSRLVGYRKATKDDATEDRKMIEAARYLETWLRFDLPRSLSRTNSLNCPFQIAVLNELPDLIQYLENKLLPPRCVGSRLPWSGKLHFVFIRQKSKAAHWTAGVCDNCETGTSYRRENDRRAESIHLVHFPFY